MSGTFGNVKDEALREMLTRYEAQLMALGSLEAVDDDGASFILNPYGELPCVRTKVFYSLASGNTYQLVSWVEYMVRRLGGGDGIRSSRSMVNVEGPLEEVFDEKTLAVVAEMLPRCLEYNKSMYPVYMDGILEKYPWMAGAMLHANYGATKDLRLMWSDRNKGFNTLSVVWDKMNPLMQAKIYFDATEPFNCYITDINLSHCGDEGMSLVARKLLLEHRLEEL